MPDEYLTNVRILVVDDQRFARQVIRSLLGVLGCTRVSEASDGEGAWKLIQEAPPDIVITDWKMEPVDGFELVKRIRSRQDNPNPFLPIIMVSAYSEAARIISARDTGINEFVMKPVSAQTLFGRLNSVIENPRRFVRSEGYFGPDRRRKEKLVAQDRRAAGGEPDAIDVAKQHPAS